ncbi:hypothetical protein AB0I35_16145 [Nocardia sp. NPDC050378]|uniref:hypothetical protein n=1 Tax=Nocardia sp. NPDC050378 TaxID=3155400 RepID=UPI0034001F87
MSAFLRRTTAACCGLALAAVLVGCGSDDGSTTAPATTSAVVTTAAAGGADAATTQAVTAAYTTFFDGKAPTNDRVALVEGGEAFRSILEGQAQTPQAQGTSVTVSAVKPTGDTTADVTYTLLMGGNPMLPDQTGQAVKEGQSWKVAKSTFCALQALQGQTPATC